MNKYFLFLLLIAFGFKSSAQTEGSAKLYGYVQEVLPGANNSVIVEGGEQVTEPKKAGKNYMIYIESTSRVYPVEIWIKGEPYSASMDVISSTPVVFGSENTGNRKVLVPKTTKKLLMLTPSPYIETKNTGDVSAIASSNELVVLYKQNGKFYYNKLEKLETLQAAAMQ